MPESLPEFAIDPAHQQHPGDVAAPGTMVVACALGLLPAPALTSPLASSKVAAYLRGVRKLSIPANATAAPSIAKVWQQVKDNAPTFATIWGLILITTLIDIVFSRLLHLLAETMGEHSHLQAEFIAMVGSLPTTTLANLATVLIMAVAAIYYATDRCPSPGEILGILIRKPLRYLLAGFLFAIAGGIGLLLCIVPGILVILTTPLYVYYVFTTDLDLITCLSKAFKGMFQDFSSFLGVSLLCGLAILASTVLCVFPVLAVLPMTALYMQNYIHHKGLVSNRELA